MRTLLVVPWKSRGGVATVVGNLANYLRERGHDVRLFHPGSNILLNTSKSLHFSDTRLRLVFPFAMPRPLVSGVAFPFLFPIILLQLMWFLRRNRIEIVNLHYPVDNFFYFTICKRLLRFQLVTSLHGGDAFSKGKPKKRYSAMFRFLLHSSDLIILPSDAYRKRLVEALPDLHVKTIFIHNGINPALYEAIESPPKSQGDSRYLLCLGDHREYKGIDILLRAASKVLREDSSLRLVLAGDGPMRSELQQLATSLGIWDQTQFIGTQEPKDIAGLLQGCEVLVVPSREESFGIVVLEAMACRKPVVAAAVGGIPEIIEDGKNGILVEPENPDALAEGLRLVLNSVQLRSRLAANGYSCVMERFCSAHNGAAYESAFASLLPEKPVCEILSA